MKSLMLIFTAAVILLAKIAFAQSEMHADSTNGEQDDFRISGDAGVYGELYSMNGQQGRRPNSTGRIFFRPTVTLFGIINIPFEFFISTEGSAARQNINQFGISPAWSWGTLHLGDFTQDYSQFTLSGIKIRGGGIELSPGSFRFGLAAGFTQRAVPGGASDGSFKRFLFAARIGWGKTESTFTDLIFLRAKDEVGSVNTKEKSINIIAPNGGDVLETGSLQTIRWISNNIGGGIKVELSRDGGSTFELIAENQPNVGFYNWTVTAPATFLGLVKLTSEEDSSIFDISDNVFTIGSGVESNMIITSVTNSNSNAVTPQENLILGTKGRINFYENRISLEFEGSSSVFTRNLRSSEINLDSVDVPSIVKGIYKPRVGTNYDYAYSTLLNLNLGSFNSRIGFKRVGPGYQSLGTAYLLNDISELSLINSFRIEGVGVNIGYIRQNDNLLDQKLFTTARNMITTGLNSMITPKWNAGISVSYMNMTNDSNNDSTKTDFSSLMLSTGHVFMLDPAGTFRSLNFNYSYQSSDNRSYLIKNSTTNVHNVNAGSSMGITDNLLSVLSLNLVSSSIFDTINTFTHAYSLLVQHNTIQNMFVNSLQFTASFSDNNSSTRIALNSGYRFSASDNITLVISYINFSGSGTRGSFNEIISGLSYSHSF